MACYAAASAAALASGRRPSARTTRTSVTANESQHRVQVHVNGAEEGVDVTLRVSNILDESARREALQIAAVLPPCALPEYPQQLKTRVTEEDWEPL